MKGGDECGRGVKGHPSPSLETLSIHWTQLPCSAGSACLSCCSAPEVEVWGGSGEPKIPENGVAYYGCVVWKGMV